MGAKLSNHAASHPDGIKREAEFDHLASGLWNMWGLTSYHTDTSAFEAILSQERVQLQLDNDPEGRAGDMQRLLTNGILIGGSFPLPVLGHLCIVLDMDKQICCQAAPLCECCGTTNCCLPRRYPFELEQAKGHRLTLKQSALHYQRDAMKALVVKHWTTTDKYGRVQHHVGERFADIPAKTMHVPLIDTELEIHAMKSMLPTPLHVWCGLVCCARLASHPEWAEPSGQVLVIKCKGQIVACMDCGSNSNVQAFVDATTQAKTSGLAMSGEAQALYASYGNPGQMQGMANMMPMMQMPMQAVPMQAVPTVSAVAVPPGPEQMDREGNSLAAQLERLEAMRKDGVLSDAEFEAAKSKTLGVV